MRFLTIVLFLFISFSYGDELKVKALKFSGDQKSGISVFEGNVNIIKNQDELNATKVTVYTDQQNNPTKFVAEGSASFNIVTQDGARYKGKSQKAIYLPQTKEYYFYTDVHLIQIDDHKEILGDEVILKSIEGKAYAKGVRDEPVIMIFNVPEDKNKDKVK